MKIVQCSFRFNKQYWFFWCYIVYFFDVFCIIIVDVYYFVYWIIQKCILLVMMLVYYFFLWVNWIVFFVLSGVFLVDFQMVEVVVGNSFVCLMFVLFFLDWC